MCMFFDDFLKKICPFARKRNFFDESKHLFVGSICLFAGRSLFDEEAAFPLEADVCSLGNLEHSDIFVNVIHLNPFSSFLFKLGM